VQKNYFPMTKSTVELNIYMTVGSQRELPCTSLC